MTAAETAAALRARLGALGVHTHAIEEAVRATAPARHAARVAAATEAALTAVASDATVVEAVAEGAERALLARLLAALEVVGVGGHAGLTGAATARACWASGLGAGRRQARDGAAWDAALAAVAGGLWLTAETDGDVSVRDAAHEAGAPCAYLVASEAVALDVLSGGRLTVLARLAVRAAATGEAGRLAPASWGRPGDVGRLLTLAPCPWGQRDAALVAWGALLGTLTGAAALVDGGVAL